MKFLKDMFSSSSCASSNRIAFYIILAFVIVRSSISWSTLTPEQMNFLERIFYTASGLMTFKLITEGFRGSRGGGCNGDGNTGQ